eukprot:CAMPEP_0185543962 /NCGR_PEP_ID=MMETSP1381-20130426/3653_1 /TAXON_ID=298111 /ORGANISM="Pavlova sp., Strain CCMP459" /LENGTH=89 /DNA_ID=CAMNT_0028156111 /DNA_START=581 /DNA_END=847 /DNA_ORIENTATION=+
MSVILMSFSASRARRRAGGGGLGVTVGGAGGGASSDPPSSDARMVLKGERTRVRTCGGARKACVIPQYMSSVSASVRVTITRRTTGDRG